MTYWRGPLITFNTKITHLSEALSSLRGVCCECNLQKDAVRPLCPSPSQAEGGLPHKRKESLWNQN